MNVEKMSIWFIGAFVGAALSVWFGVFWILGAFAGAAVGVILTVRSELWHLVCCVTGSLLRFPSCIYAWCKKFVGDMRVNDLLRKNTLVGFYQGICMGHVAAFIFAFPILALVLKTKQENDYMVLTYLVLVAFALSSCIPVLLALIDYTSPTTDEVVIESDFLTWKKRVKRFNLVSLPFFLLFFGFTRLYKFICTKWRSTDIRHALKNFLRAVHSHAAVTSAIFCGLGSLVGTKFHNPFLGGFAGMAFGCVEYWFMKKFVLPGLSASGS